MDRPLNTLDNNDKYDKIVSPFERGNYMIKKVGRITKFFKGGKKCASQAEALLNVLEYKDEGYYIAHCLEFDIVAQGSTQEEARKMLAELIKEQIVFTTEKDIEEKALFHTAPEKYWHILHQVRTRRARKALLEDDPRHLTTKDILGCMESTNAALAGQAA